MVGLILVNLANTQEEEEENELCKDWGVSCDSAQTILPNWGDAHQVKIAVMRVLSQRNII